MFLGELLCYFFCLLYLLLPTIDLPRFPSNVNRIQGGSLHKGYKVPVYTRQKLSLDGGRVFQ